MPGRRPHVYQPAVGRHPVEFWVYVPHQSRKPRSADGTGTIYGPFTSRQTAAEFTGRQMAGSFVMGPFVATPRRRTAGTRERERGRERRRMKVTRRTLGQAEKEAEERREKIGFWLKELENPVGRLTAWELQFVESVADQFARQGALTNKQVEVLERIYAARTA